jgi:hypothetical protein
MQLALIFFLATTVIPPLAAGQGCWSANAGPGGVMKIRVFVTGKFREGKGCRVSWMPFSVSKFNIT